MLCDNWIVIFVSIIYLLVLQIEPASFAILLIRNAVISIFPYQFR